jgi:hypothetical protein
MGYNGHIWGNGGSGGSRYNVEHLNCNMVREEKEKKTFKKEEDFVSSL